MCELKSVSCFVLTREGKPKMTEWDYEDMPDEFVEEHGYIQPSDLVAIWHDIGAEYAADKLRDDFVGIYDRFRDYSDETADEMLAAYDVKEDSLLVRYFDYSAWERDLRFDMHVIDLPSGGVAVFYA